MGLTLPLPSLGRATGLRAENVVEPAGHDRISAENVGWCTAERRV